MFRDHSGGNIELCSKISGLEVVGGVGDAIPGVTHEVNDGDIVLLGPLSVRVLFLILRFFRAFFLK